MAVNPFFSNENALSQRDLDAFNSPGYPQIGGRRWQQQQDTQARSSSFGAFRQQNAYKDVISNFDFEDGSLGGGKRKNMHDIEEEVNEQDETCGFPEPSTLINNWLSAEEAFSFQKQSGY